MSIEGLLYIIGVCTYGGRTTDIWDVRTLNTLLRKFICTAFFNSNECHVGCLTITFPEEGKVRYKNLSSKISCALLLILSYLKSVIFQYENYLELVKTLPTSTSPEHLGLHPNARIVTANAAMNHLLKNMLLTQLGIMQQVCII